MRYRGKVIPLYEGHRQEAKASWEYTDAVSIAQAGRFLGTRYPYPKYLVEEVIPDPRVAIPKAAERVLEHNPCICEVFGEIEKEFTEAEALEIGGILGIDWEKVNVEQFKEGLKVELEHGCRDKQTNITCDDPALTGKIALAHLVENKAYYSKLLKEVEK